MLRQAICSAVVLGALVTGSGAALAENRVALVIGESAYRSVTPLPNPANDAKAMSKLLAESGFEVTSLSDLSRSEMNAQVGDFASRIAAKGPDTVALVFYAGHGLQIDGENYLVPVDVDPRREADIPLQAIRLNDVLNTLNSVPSKMRILLLDACRNNPFPAISTTAGRGLAMVDAKTGAPGTFLSYSTSPGAEAEDGGGADSPYTTALLTAARTPGLPIEQAFKQVRLAVNTATSGRQTPWDSSSLTDNFEFIAGSGPHAALTGAKPDVTKRSVEDWRGLLRGMPVDVAHGMVVTDGTLEAYEAFVALYAQSRFATEARDWIVLRRRMVAWNDAVMINTAASYRTFLVDHGDSDLALTARKLIQRLRLKPGVMPTVAAMAPANVALGPCTIPAPSNPPALKKADLAPAMESLPPVIVKKVDVTTPRNPNPSVRVMALPPRQVMNEPPVNRGPPLVYRPTGVHMGFVGGFGGGGFGRGPIGFGRHY